MTQWITIPGCSDYEVSDMGQVKSKKFGKEKILSPSTSGDYMKVSMTCDSGTRISKTVHRLVAEGFVEKKDKTHDIVNHIDGNKTNAKATNLEWTNHYGNMKHYSEVLSPKRIAGKKKKEHTTRGSILQVLKVAVNILDAIDFQRMAKAIL